MFDREIVMDNLQKIRKVIEIILERASVVTDPNELLCSPDGMMRLDAICMNLIALGEAVKGLDKQTHGQLLPHYPEVYWSGVKKMRDKIAHHYFEIDTDVVFRTVQEEVPQMQVVINKMISDFTAKGIKEM
ncbi:MAG: DUF86 domain-containing protein [Bacteroidaceae bacterium]|nr:DUF86 domain-containing protein [Bacteroidaceae bacterium]